MLICTKWDYLCSHKELSTFLLSLQGCFVRKMQAPSSFLQNLYQLKVHLEIQNMRNSILPRNSNRFKAVVKYLWRFLLSQLEMLSAPTLCFDLLLQHSLPPPTPFPTQQMENMTTLLFLQVKSRTCLSWQWRHDENIDFHYLFLLTLLHEVYNNFINYCIKSLEFVFHVLNTSSY